MNEQTLLERIRFNPQIFGGKPIICGRRLAVEHILGMLAASDTTETLLIRSISLVRTGRCASLFSLRS